MAYPSNETDIPLQFLRLGGLNQRVAPNVLPAPEFSVLQGLYPAQDGILERLPGIRPLAIAGNGTAGIWQIFQPNDGTDNIIIQTSDGTERIYTLNELFGRTVVSNLTYTPLPSEEDMPTATILHDAANTVGGGSIPTANTWTIREITSIPLNEDSIIVGQTLGASGSFTLAPGTYRIRGFVSAYASIAATATNTGGGPCGYQAVLSNVTDGVTQCVGSPAKVSFIRSATNMNVTLEATLKSEFDYTFDVVGSNKVFSVYNAFNHSGSNIAVTTSGGSDSDVTAAINGAAVRMPYMVLNISKTA